jgi:hypothetical protein
MHVLLVYFFFCIKQYYGYIKFTFSFCFVGSNLIHHYVVEYVYN